MKRFLLLAGYFEMSMYLYVSGKLDHYINLHYSYLAFLSMTLSFVLALVQLVIWVKQIKPHSHLTKPLSRFSSLVLLALPLAVAWLFPTVTLDSTTVAAKGYHFPLAAGVDSATQEQEGTSVQYLKPDTSAYFTKSAYQEEMSKIAQTYKDQDTITITTDNYMEVMEVIYSYPDQFIGKNIEMMGFVYNDPDDPQKQFLFRFGIIHCIADSGVYGLLTTGHAQTLSDNTWIVARGKLELTYHASLKQSLPTLRLDSLQEVAAPDNPYVYRDF